MWVRQLNESLSGAVPLGGNVANDFPRNTIQIVRMHPHDNVRMQAATTLSLQSRDVIRDSAPDFGPLLVQHKVVQEFVQPVLEKQRALDWRTLP